MKINHKVVDILLVDDHALFRDGLRGILQTNPSFRIVGEASDGAAAMEIAAAVRPDVMLLDVEMDGTHVSTTVRHLRETVPNCHIIVLTMHDDPQLLVELLSLGVRGYLLKSVGWKELISAVSSVATDPSRVVLSVSPRTVMRVHTPQSNPLSSRELEILRLTAQAMSNGQIASRLSLTEATIKRHLHNVFRKLGAVSRLDAVNKARSAGLFGSDPPISGRPGSFGGVVARAG